MIRCPWLWWLVAHGHGGGGSIGGGQSIDERFVVLRSVGRWLLLDVHIIGDSNGRIAATVPPGGRGDDLCGRRQKVASEGDLMLSVGVAYGDAGLQPDVHTSLLKGDEIFL
jgi:hypothetical protein